MTDTIEIHSSGGLDDWGLPIKSEPVNVRGRYMYNSKRDRISTANGDEIVYSADIYLPYETDISYDHTLKIVDVMGNTVKKKPLVIQHKRDFWGTPLMLRVVI